MYELGQAKACDCYVPWMDCNSCKKHSLEKIKEIARKMALVRETDEKFIEGFVETFVRFAKNDNLIAG